MDAPNILVINPNSSRSMTDALDQLIHDIDRHGTTTATATTSIVVHTYTAPSGPPSINNDADALESANVCLRDLEPRLPQYSAYLVACYSVHPLVSMLRAKVATGVHVTSIFEASISVSLSLLPQDPKQAPSKFGIVSTGEYWEKALSDGVKEFLGLDDVKNSMRFKGVVTTGLNANDLHTAPPELVKKMMVEATKRLVRDRDVKVICLGCAGMAGLDAIVDEALRGELGEDAKYVYVLDGVKAGIGLLKGLLYALPGTRL
ncbi:Uncharacterized protein BP5553_03270 [Venustampulla echinocandica]|uniref:DCG1 protein n=1 Tax=Venustampulla echinocandica TaxID=2656787 RepID=A0A370TTU2_9HELO|nr:Uncharacterized protein BP5553_03270 [Venustampulla echinocandica]RDL38930.1 Uncharacterized protein BP5553_03270 [Venustampulla echinocandica]